MVAWSQFSLTVTSLNTYSRVMSRIKRASLAILMPTALVLCAGVEARPRPAFLDGWNKVTVWVEQASRPSEVADRFRVRVGREVVPIISVEGRERARPLAQPGQVVLAGSFQTAFGDDAWDPNGQSTLMRSVREGVFEYVNRFPRGHWEYKVARGGSWAENWGRGFAPAGANIGLHVREEGQIVRFVVDFNRGTVKDSINNPGDVDAPATVPAAEEAPSLAGKYQSFSLTLGRPVTAREIMNPIWIEGAGAEPRWVVARDVLDEEEFVYPRQDLGNRWTPSRTTFKVWSPVSSSVTLRMFGSVDGPVKREVPMKRGRYGVWYVEVPGNLDGTFYQYVLTSYGRTRVAADIYARAASPDSARSMVLDMRRTNPESWPVPRLFSGSRHTDAVIYEFHIRDFTVDASSGVRPEWRGKYLGLTERGTREPRTGFVTGLDYLVDLGVSHVHLLPFQDFNPAHSQNYNWGYETTLFNVPEEQYGTRASDPVQTIRETKKMIQALQRRGIGVILDVVYNHTVPSEGELSAFWELVPYFYFRTNDRGDVLNESGVGNATHDERPMVRHFLVDSLRFWTREYRLDGYRFDLLGMFTRDTVALLERVIREELPQAVIYGEPWTGGGPIRFGKGAQRGLGVAVFNDRFRGAFRGELDGVGPGFAMGAGGAAAVKRAVVGSIDFSSDVTDFASHPKETVNYVSAHDNLAFWDKVAVSMPGASEAEHAAAVRLAHVAVLLSQGVPFIEGGVNLGRTKGGNNNSYNAGDAVNKYDWARAGKFTEMNDFFRELIAIRRGQPMFRLEKSDEVRKRLSFLETGSDTIVAWRLDGRGLGGTWNEAIVVLNGSSVPAAFTLPEGRWTVAVRDHRASRTGLGSEQGSVQLPRLSGFVAWR